MSKDIKILISDDSEFMRNVLKDILTEAGYSSFAEASNGNECLEAIKDEQPDLLLLDMIMPEKTGIEVLKELAGSVKCIVISAVGQEEMIEEAKTNGAIGYIVKPFENEQVLEEIGKAFPSAQAAT